MASESTSTLLLVRHGQSEWNAQHRWQGQANSPLTELGQEQARQAATKIGQVDVVVSSPQDRASETAAIISEQIGVGPVQIVDGLQERNASIWSGLTKVEIEEQWPGWIDSGQRPQGWEHDEALTTRVMAALQSVVTNFGGAQVLVVCHGGVIVQIEKNLGLQHRLLPNLGGRILRYSDDTFSPLEPLELLPQDLVTGGSSSRV